MVILLTQEESIQMSLKYPNSRIEVFSKNKDLVGYSPAYSYYKNGKFYKLTND